jgi:hypothetical protein
VRKHSLSILFEIFVLFVTVLLAAGLTGCGPAAKPAPAPAPRQDTVTAPAGQPPGVSPAVPAADRVPLPKKTRAHIFHGEINDQGKAVGWHFEDTAKNDQGTRIVKLIGNPDSKGVYRAEVEIKGLKKEAMSTFFPKTMTIQTVVAAVGEAWRARKPVGGKGNYFEGRSAGGLLIGMYLDEQGNIRSAFPIYGK